MPLCGLRLFAARSLRCRACVRCLVAQAGQQPASARKQQLHRLSLFKEEKEKQARGAGSGKKIEVSLLRPDGESSAVQAEAGVSTPLSVASDVSPELASDCALALVDNAPWEARRPLTDSCSLRLLRFKPPASAEEVRDIQLCNAALWRSGSLLLGSVLETAFKDEYRLALVSFPPPMTKSGSFVYDCQLTKPRAEHSILELSDELHWHPSQAELRLLSTRVSRLLAANLQYETLDVPAAVARRMFADNPHKLEAVRRILEGGNRQTLTVSRVGEFVDISGGPAIANTGLIGRFLVTAVHAVESRELGRLLRVQGLAVPRAFLQQFASFDSLVARAAALNTWHLPSSQSPAAPVGQRARG